MKSRNPVTVESPDCRFALSENRCADDLIVPWSFLGHISEFCHTLARNTYGLVNLAIARRLLARLGVSVVTANGGAEAVRVVEESEFDLILMDLMLPGVDGIEATKQIRSLAQEWSDLPIVAFSAGIVGSIREEAMGAGLDDFLEKPVRLRSPISVLTKHVGE